MLSYLLLQIFAVVVGGTAALFLIVHSIKLKSFKKAVLHKHVLIPFTIFVVALIVGLYGDKTYAPHFAMPPFMHSHAPGGVNPDLPFSSVISFFANKNKFEHISDISQDPQNIPPAIGNREPQTVEIKMKTKEVISEIAPDIYFNYWTYDGKVPGPFLRVKEGDTVLLTLTNDETSLHHHNIDLHAVTGTGGGAELSRVKPGETKTFKWKALNPGLYIYHCAMPNVSSHNSHGQYGLILVEPKEGLSPVDKEFYIVQGELYTIGEIGKRGLTAFDTKGLIDGNPNYVVFNGRIDTATPRLTAKAGEKIRMYVGNGGVNLISSFHVIGEIFDTVYPEGAMGEGSAVLKNVQTTAVLPGGSTIVEFKVDVPGKYLLVDHALARMNKGAWAVLEVTGEENKDIYSAVSGGDAKDENHEGGYGH
jgi:nitrite reductase (NO-forming)